MKTIKGYTYSNPIMERKFKQWLFFKLARHAKRNLGSTHALSANAYVHKNVL